MLLRLAYFTTMTTFALMRLLPMSDRDKNLEILALRHQLLVLQRQAGKPAFTDTDRANSVMERWIHTCRRELLDRTPS
jgi:putative transposase